MDLKACCPWEGPDHPLGHIRMSEFARLCAMHVRYLPRIHGTPIADVILDSRLSFAVVFRNLIVQGTRVA
jgi:hypothetical protein